MLKIRGLAGFVNWGGFGYFLWLSFVGLCLCASALVVLWWFLVCSVGSLLVLCLLLAGPIVPFSGEIAICQFGCFLVASWLVGC